MPASKLKPIDPSAPYAFANANMSKIDYYGLGETVIELRRKGMSYLNISRELSTNYLDKTNGDTISMDAVSRWLKQHEEESADYESEYIAVNAYRENLKMLRLVDNNIEMLKVFLDAVQNMIASGADDATVLKMFRHTKELQTELEHYIARKQSIVTNIYNSQKEIFNMMTLNEIIRTTLDTVRKLDKGIYAKVLVQLRNNPKYVEAIKKIDDTDVN